MGSRRRHGACGPPLAAGTDLCAKVAAMDEPRFPLYRRSANGLNWYRVDSFTRLVEVQRVGSRLLLHHLQAVAWPEQARIRELIAMLDGLVEECSASEVEELIALV